MTTIERPATENDAFDQACAMEDPLAGIEHLAGALMRVARTLADDGDTVIILHLAEAIRAHVRELDEAHQFFFRHTHPDRGKFEREGWPEDQAAEAT
jgi:hypothetical protein